MLYSKKNQGEWTITPAYTEMDFSATVGFAIDEYAEVDLEFVADMSSEFTYRNGTYTFETMEEGDMIRTEVKIVDGKFVWGSFSEYGKAVVDGKFTQDNWSVTFSITYGDASIGDFSTVENRL